MRNDVRHWSGILLATERVLRGIDAQVKPIGKVGINARPSGQPASIATCCEIRPFLQTSNCVRESF